MRSVKRRLLAGYLFFLIHIMINIKALKFFLKIPLIPLIIIL